MRFRFYPVLSFLGQCAICRVSDSPVPIAAMEWSVLRYLAGQEMETTGPALWPAFGKGREQHERPQGYFQEER